MKLRLAVRTPHGVAFDAPVSRILAEDLDGWFGIAPGRSDLVAVLPPGLLVARDGDGELFVALAGGLLNLKDDSCRVTARDATVSRDLDEISGRAEELVRARGSRRQRQAGVIDELVREALRRMAKEVER
ncbi:MAG: F0F1 ATP synthase subunit epsilon [Polyangiaceae bacterium]|nr:F0F1 ATP synthase subunit epsilon [Polyangiaceae bacterium]